MDNPKVRDLVGKYYRIGRIFFTYTQYNFTVVEVVGGNDNYYSEYRYQVRLYDGSKIDLADRQLEEEVTVQEWIEQKLET